MNPTRVAQVVAAALLTAARDPTARAVSTLLDALRETLARWLGDRAAAGTDPAALATLPAAGLREVLVRAQAVLAVTDPGGTADGRYAVAPGEEINSAGEIDSAGDGLTMQRVAFSGGTTPGNSTSRAGISLAHGSARQAAEIVRIERQIFADIERRLGADHPDTATARLSLANVYHWTGRKGAAVDTLQRVVTDRERLLGADHPDTLVARARLRSWTG
jgi:hypothetical protein